MMTNPRKSKPNLDDQLADYTDRILAGSAVNQDEAAFAPDPDLRALEQTALRLIKSFDTSDPDNASIQRMHTNIIGKWKQEKILASVPFWQKWMGALKPSPPKWQSRHSRQRLSLTLFLASIAVLIVISIPYLSTIGSTQPGAGGQDLNVYILIPFVGLILLALWLFRRKP